MEKGESQSGYYKIIKQVKFFENRTFLTPRVRIKG